MNERLLISIHDSSAEISFGNGIDDGIESEIFRYDTGAAAAADKLEALARRIRGKYVPPVARPTIFGMNTVAAHGGVQLDWSEKGKKLKTLIINDSRPGANVKEEAAAYAGCFRQFADDIDPPAIAVEPKRVPVEPVMQWPAGTPLSDQLDHFISELALGNVPHLKACRELTRLTGELRVLETTHSASISESPLPLMDVETPGNPTPTQQRAAWAFVAATLHYARTFVRDGFDERVIDSAHVVALAHAKRG